MEILPISRALKRRRMNILRSFSASANIAMNLDVIPVLNDAAGGVTVTLEDDFSALDASMTRVKAMTLMGEQAEIFVRSPPTVFRPQRHVRWGRKPRVSKVSLRRSAARQEPKASRQRVHS